METYRGTVYPWEVDHMGHMNVRFYMAKFDSATWQLFGAIGLTSTWLREQSRGMAAVEQTIKYRAELFGGDLVVCRSSIVKLSASTVHMRHVMLNCETDEEAASTDLVAVHMDRRDRKSRPLPDFVRSRAALVAEKEPPS